MKMHLVGAELFNANR